MFHAAGRTRTVPVTGARSIFVSDITGRASALPGFDAHERVLLGRDEACGLTAIVAIHSTARGPALGGTRIWSYASEDEAITDMMRLSRRMTLKAAIAELPFGGAKAVIVADPAKAKTPQLLDAYADVLATLTDSFITAEDVGLTTADADHLRARVPNMSAMTLGGAGSPAPFTAHGVFLGIKAALRHNRGHDDLTGIRVALQGLGSVGWALAEELHDAGARLVVADLDADRVATAVVGFGAEAADARTIMSAEADIFAPCASGAIVNDETIPLLTGDIVAGSATGPLARHDHARDLCRRGILYAPDYVINAGGLINVAAEFAPGGYDRQAVRRRIDRIPATLTAIFERARGEGRPTNEIAQAVAMERIARS